MKQQIPNKPHKTFGTNESIPHSTVKYIRIEDPYHKQFSQVDYKRIQTANREFSSNLQMVKLNFPFGTVGFDRPTLKKIGMKNLRNIHDISDLLTPLDSSLDPRNNQEKTVFEANPHLNEMIGNKVAVKHMDRSGDGLSPEQQFEAGKLLEKAVNQAGLGDLVEINKAFGYIQSSEHGNLLFLEKVNGANFQQMQRNEKDGIAKEDIQNITDQLITQLEQMKATITSDTDYNEGKRIASENMLQTSLRLLKHANQKTDLNKDKRADLKEKYPKGYRETINSLEFFYAQNHHILDRIQGIITELQSQYQDQDSSIVYNTIAGALQYIIHGKSDINQGFVSDINKTHSYGQDNLMWDEVKKKIIIIDPGPPIGLA